MCPQVTTLKKIYLWGVKEGKVQSVTLGKKSSFLMD